MDVTKEAVKNYYETRYGHYMLPVSVTGNIDDDTEILAAYLGKEPEMPCFGKIVVLVWHKNRAFSVRFHVWAPDQNSSMAHRLENIEEFTVRQHGNVGFIETVSTDFGLKAFWLNTPDAELDENGRILRKIAKKLKRYGVDNNFCRRLRNEWNKNEDCKERTAAIEQAYRDICLA